MPNHINIRVKIGRVIGIGTKLRNAVRTLLVLAGLSCLTLWAGPTFGTVSFVQTAGSASDSPSSSISQSFRSSNAAGNLIVVVASWGDNPAPSISASDTLGNSYLLATTDYDPNHRQGLTIFYAPNIHSGQNTVTVHFGPSDGYRHIVIAEYSGIAGVSPLDTTATHQANGTKTTNGITSSFASTTANGDLIFGAVEDDSGPWGTITAGTGFTRRATLNNMDTATEDRVQTALGPAAATFTFRLADHYMAQMAAFRATGSGGGTPPNLSSLGCSTYTLSPGTTSSCIATLTQAAPAGGSTVSLSSSNNTLVTVPGSAVVLAGQTSVTFLATAGSSLTNGTATITATDGNSESLSIYFDPPPAPQLAITTNSLMDGQVRLAYTATLAATGGSAPYTWTISSGQLPTGLSLASSTGVISGTPTAAGTASFSAEVTDQTGATATTNLSIHVAAASSSGRQATLINGQRQLNSFMAQGSGNGPVTGACDDNVTFLPYHFCLADVSLAGNAVVAACTWQAGAFTPSLTDDKGSSYAAQFATAPSDGNQTIQFFVAVNVVAGIHELRLNFSGGTPGYMQCAAYQIQNIAPAAASCGMTSAAFHGTTAVAAESFTPTADDCFILQLAVQDDTLPGGTWSAGGNFTMQDASPREGFAVQSWAAGAAAALNPTLTLSTAGSGITAAIALQSAASGSGPTGMYVRRISQNSLSEGKSSYTFQVPCSGDLVVVAFNGNTGEWLTSVTGSNPTATYTQIGNGISGGEGIQQIWQSPANLACTGNHTITISGTTISAGDVVFYDVVGAASVSPLDGLVTDSGDQGNFGSPLAAASITPSSSSGIVFCTAGIADNGSLSFNPTGYQDNQDQNNGWGHYSYSSNATIHTSWGTDERQAAGGVGEYSEACAAFQSAGN